MLLGVFAVAVLVFGGLLVFSMMDNEDEREDKTEEITEKKESTTTTTPSTDEEEEPTAEVDFTIEAKNFAYTPENITAAPGQTLTIEFVNKSGSHDFVIDELDVDSGLVNGTKIVIVEIPADAEPGTEYTYYCSVSNHRQLGMEGTITVE